MTQDEILAMKPGPGLSALVGEHVINECRHDFERCGPNFWNYQCRKCGMEDSNFVKKLHIVGEDKPYSTDIAAAFEAEEIAIEKDPAMYVHALASVVFGYNQVQDISDIKKLCLLIHATPEQRCKAALLAVMEE